MKKQQLYTRILSLVLLLNASQAVKAQAEVVSGGAPTPLALGPGPVLPTSGGPTPLLGGMKYNDVTDQLSIDLASLNNVMDAAHKILGVQIFSLQDNPMTGYIAIDGKKVANYTLERDIPQDGSGVALGQLNGYYLVVNASDFAQLYQAKLLAMANIIKSGAKKDWQQKMQQAKTEFGVKVGSFLKDLGTKFEKGAKNR